jgi:hypothetical protein
MPIKYSKMAIKYTSVFESKALQILTQFEIFGSKIGKPSGNPDAEPITRMLGLIGWNS